MNDATPVHAADPQTLRLLCACAFASMAAMRACDAMLPALASRFGATAGQAAQTISGFALAYGVAQLAYGPLGDRYGKQRVIGLATLGCTLGNLAVALSSSLHGLVAGRVLSGAAAAGVIPLAMAWIGDSVPLGQRQEVLARLLGATVIGMVVGQWGGGLLAEAGAWRLVFALLAAAFLVAGGLLLRAADRPPAPAVRPARAGAAFADVLAQPWARTVLCITFIEGALAFGALAFLATHLHARYGLAMSVAGAVVALYGVGGLLYSRNARRLLARLGGGPLAWWGACCLAASLLVIAYAPTWAWTMPACLVAGLGFYALHNFLQTQATQMAPAVRGTAMASFACVLFLGQSVGVTAAAWLVDRASTSAVLAIAATGLLALGGVLARLCRAHASAPHDGL